jgi:NhaA family Na+:H+ antiporter
VHATIAGVLTATAIPLRSPHGGSPLVNLEHALKGWVQLGIMPLFALANAGVPLAGITAQAFAHPVAIGTGFGLLLGKPIGICLSTWIGAAMLKRPSPASPMQLLGLSFVAGIGFTMSLFIGALAFGAGPLATPVRIGVFGGSILAALIGLAILAVAAKGKPDADLASDEDVAEGRDVLDRD